MFQKLVSLLKLLNSNSKPSQIGNSVCIGLLLGFMQKNNLLWYILLVFFLFVRINKGVYGLMLILGSFLAPFLDPLFNRIGFFVLTYPAFENTFARLLQIPFVGFTRFNNTVVAGSLCFSLAIYIPLLFIVMIFIALWRKYITPAFNKSKLAKSIYGIPLVAKLTGRKL